MIIVRMLGGLGNQMFQHAVGTALARHHSCELRWDLSAYAFAESQRSFELQRVFGLDLPRADESAFRSLLGWRGQRAVRTLFNQRYLTWARPSAYVIEPHFQFWPGFWSQPSSSYLDGYWQSARYFEATNRAIREAFTFPIGLSNLNQAVANQIESCNSVSIHVRRGDYMTNPSTNQYHGCCSPAYYTRATREMSDQLDDPHFFVFSDDPEWAQTNLALPAPCTFIAHNQGDASYNDMHLMSLCRHNIIANSSFSWWGAWLGASPDKLVIAPKQWFKNGLIDTSDLYCSDWVQL